jgi:hypothetical protein
MVSKAARIALIKSQASSNEAGYAISASYLHSLVAASPKSVVSQDEDNFLGHHGDKVLRALSMCHYACPSSECCVLWVSVSLVPFSHCHNAEFRRGELCKHSHLKPSLVVPKGVGHIKALTVAEDLGHCCVCGERKRFVKELRQ